MIIITLGVYIYHLKHKEIEIAQINAETILQNNIIQQELENKKAELEGKKAEIEGKKVELDNMAQSLSGQQKIINSLNRAAEDMRKTAEKRAEEEYERKKETFDGKLKEYQVSASASIEKELSILASRKEQEARMLKDLEDKQLAYIQAKQRQEEIDNDQDYYRLVISEDDKSDISFLRDMQKRLVKKDSIDKVIYETYYRPAYDTLMSHLFTSSNKACGIYKITDLTTGLAYIGQSVDMKERFRQHIKSSLAYGVSSNRLYQTMQKSGQHNFTFEILEELPRDKLNEREVYWIDFYKTKEYGLNSTRGGA